MLHHLVFASAMLACVLVDNRPIPSLLLVMALVTISVLCAIHARKNLAARELMLDLGVMGIFILAMAPRATAAATHSGPAMSMSVESMAAHGHSDVSVTGMLVMVLASAFWAVARVRLLFVGGRPRVTASVGAVVCLAGLAWMLA